jgi:N6-L-threonylcarbamoyladenine synthase
VLSLVVSGGHTHLYLAERVAAAWRYENIGHTRDDAAGEAYDKVAKLLGLGYPGGPIIDELAKFGDASAIRFPFAQLKHRDRKDRGKPEPERPQFDFSYSGIKTAVLRYVEVEGMLPKVEARRQALLRLDKLTIDDYRAACDQKILNLIASFQRAMVDDLAAKTLLAAESYGVATLLITGGVAANSELRATFERRGAEEGVQVLFPSRPLSTDNAAMIAAAAYPKFLARDFAGLDLSAEASLQLK